MNRNQFIGIAGAIAALVVLAGWLLTARQALAGIALPEDRPADRLAFAVRWLPVLGSMLLIGVWAAARRGFHADAIEGTRFPTGRGLEINLRYNQNTIEQVILAAIAWAGLSLELPVSQLYLIPALAVTFAVGRVTFWTGYLLHPMGRAFGMTVTILPTICAYGWLGWHALNA